MSLLVLGLSHHGAPMSLLESASSTRRPALASRPRSSRPSTSSRPSSLSTCNRTEVYAEGLTFHGALADISDALAEAATGVDRRTSSPTSTSTTRTAASPTRSPWLPGSTRWPSARPRSSVSCATHWRAPSDVVTSAQRSTPFCSSPFGSPRGCTPRPRSTDVSRSLVGAGLSAAEDDLGPMSDARVLVVGAGGMGALAAVTASQAGAASVAIANRGPRPSRAMAGGSVASRCRGTDASSLSATPTSSSRAPAPPASSSAD